MSPGKGYIAEEGLLPWEGCSAAMLWTLQSCPRLVAVSGSSTSLGGWQGGGWGRGCSLQGCPHSKRSRRKAEACEARDCRVLSWLWRNKGIWGAALGRLCYQRLQLSQPPCKLFFLPQHRTKCRAGCGGCTLVPCPQEHAPSHLCPCVGSHTRAHTHIGPPGSTCARPHTQRQAAHLHSPAQGRGVAFLCHPPPHAGSQLWHREAAKPDMGQTRTMPMVGHGNQHSPQPGFILPCPPRRVSRISRVVLVGTGV